ncbi:MAG: hypothetical protein HYV09_27900 [Deltaproteobacteria bacterium]|nr:hypothetical protein [Deltaproteobacteria bacterium]
MRAPLAHVLSCLLCVGCAPSPPASSSPAPPRPVPGLGPEESVPTLPGVEACADAPLVTLEQIADGAHAGERVALDAVPRAMVICTLLLCTGGDEPPERTCCNGCGGGYELRLGERLLLQFANLGGCGGMDCNLHCEPFGRRPTRRYRFVGKNEFTPRPESGAIYAKSRFVVERVCAL